jgi:hypothetical protein
MPADREWCLDCTADLETDGVTWRCRPCGRGGRYMIAPNGWRVRVVTKQVAA